MRRTAVAFVASLGLHATVLGGLGLSAAHAFTPNFYVVPIAVEEVRQLPLGPMPKAPKARAQPKDAARSRKLTPPKPSEVVAPAPKPKAPAPASAAEAPATAEVVSTTRRGDVLAYGPEGSRVVAILRIDRLRAAPDAEAYIAAVDGALRLLPDRQRLLENTDLDLYRDFDALLVATPNPLDDTATFLAARHRLEDKALRAALDRGAKAGGRSVRWWIEHGRFVGARKGPAPKRDDRLFVLPAAGLLVIASPAYTKLLLHDDAARKDAGAETDSVPGSAPDERADRGWSSLVTQLDDENGDVPEDAAFVLTATNLLRPARGNAVTPRGAAGKPSETVPTAAVAPMPGVISVIVGTASTPFIELRAEFEREDDAKSFEARWPAWKQTMLANPLVMLGHLDVLVSGIQLAREERTVVLRATPTAEEMLRLLRLGASFAPPNADPGRAPASSRPTRQ